MGIGRVIIVVIMISVSISVASGTAGMATFYTDLLPSACYENKNEGTMIAAANPKLYNKGAACGRKYKVRCTGGKKHGCRKGTITVKIVDLCLGCGHNQLDLSKQAFSKIANPAAGKVHISFVEV